jgi:MEDS: MEthanogen/methylotroph, DcmR Sensory domain
VTHQEGVIHGDVDSLHIVQLFDSTESLADAVATFLREGVSRGDSLLVVVRLEHWNLTAARLTRQELPLGHAIASGQLTVRDADRTLKRFLRDGAPDRMLFDDHVGGLVRQLAARRNRLRIYGGMVDILASDGDFQAAHQLEELWNELGAREPFTLLCGYSAVNFSDPRNADALRSICRSHSHVRSNPHDTLGTYLLEANDVHASSQHQGSP